MRIENLPDGMFQKVHFLEVTDSTNDYLKQFVEKGKPLIAQAGEQRAGRGRQNRQWLSPRNQGLYISFLFYPQWFSGLSPILNAVGVLAVLKSLRSLVPSGTSVYAKRPNDVLIGGKKVSGVLVELSTLGAKIKWAIVGIGINIFQEEFSGLDCPKIPPTSLWLEGGNPKSLGQVRQPLIQAFSDYLQEAQDGKRSALELQFQKELDISG